MDKRYPCFCCSFLTLQSPENGSFEVCPVCFWEDDFVQNQDPEFEGGANRVSLEKARRNFIDFGACDRESVGHVRPPTLMDLPVLRAYGFLERQHLAAIRRKSKVQVLAIMRGMMAGHIGLIEGARRVSSLVHTIDEPEWFEKLRIFRGIASETDDFPTESARVFWERTVLARKDQDLASYMRRISDDTLAECEVLERALRSDLLADAG